MTQTQTERPGDLGLCRSDGEGGGERVGRRYGKMDSCGSISCVDR